MESKLYLVFREEYDEWLRFGRCYDKLVGIFESLDGADSAINKLAAQKTCDRSHKYYVIVGTPNNILSNHKPVKITIM